MDVSLSFSERVDRYARDQTQKEAMATISDFREIVARTRETIARSRELLRIVELDEIRVWRSRAVED